MPFEAPLTASWPVMPSRILVDNEIHIVHVCSGNHTVLMKSWDVDRHCARTRRDDGIRDEMKRRLFRSELETSEIGLSLLPPQLSWRQLAKSCRTPT